MGGRNWANWKRVSRRPCSGSQPPSSAAAWRPLPSPAGLPGAIPPCADTRMNRAPNRRRRFSSPPLSIGGAGPPWYGGSKRMIRAPHRRKRRGKSMDATERRHLLERYAEGYDAVTDALQGITERELDQQAADGWTPRQIVHHLADSETTSYIRVRRLLAEDQPVIQGYDEELFARTLHYDRPIGSSLEVFRAVRRATVSLLECLTEADWARTGTHSEQGRYGVEDWLTIYANH